MAKKTKAKKAGPHGAVKPRKRGSAAVSVPGKRKASTALVRRTATQQLEERVVQPGSIALGQLGRATLNFTKVEKLAMAAPFPQEKLRIKPTGAVYLSHPDYTLRLNEIFGVGMWMIVPAGEPKLAENTVAVPYILFIKGKEAAQAWGEQEYYANNRQQTYGDALESTVASALRRCCKRLGIGLELWDRNYVDAFVAAHAMRVKVRLKKRKEGDRAFDYLWRLKVSPPFWNEVGPASREEDVAELDRELERRGGSRSGQADRRREAPASDGRGDETIPPEAQRRLWTIIRNAGREEPEILRFLKRAYGIESTAAIKKKDYDSICEQVEAPGDLAPPPLDAELVD